MSVHLSEGERRQDHHAPSEVGRARWLGLETINPTQKQTLDRRPPWAIRRIDRHPNSEHAEPAALFVVKAAAAATSAEEGDLCDNVSAEPKQMGLTSDKCRATKRESLEEQKSRLLRRGDWVGTNITAPLKVRYPAVTDRCNIAKRRRLDKGHLPQFAAGPLQRIRDSTRMHPAAYGLSYGLSGHHDPRAFEEPFIQIGGRAEGARPRQPNLGLEVSGGRAPAADPGRASVSESTIPIMVEAERHEPRTVWPQINLSLQDAAERARPSDRSQSLVSDSIIPDMIEAEPDRFKIKSLQYQNAGRGSIESYRKTVTPSRGAKSKERNRISRTQITPARRRHALSELGSNKPQIDRLLRPLSTLKIRSNWDTKHSRMERKLFDPDDSVQVTSEARLLGDHLSQGTNNPDPPTPMGTEILYPPGLPDGVFRLPPSPSLGAAGRVTKEPVTDDPREPRSTVPNVGTDSEPSSMVSIADENAWKEWVSAESSGGTWKEWVSATSSRDVAGDQSRSQEGPSNSHDYDEREESFQAITTDSSGARSECNIALTPSTNMARFGSPIFHGNEQGRRLLYDKQSPSRSGTASAKERRGNNAEESWMNFVFSDDALNEEHED
ncbi:MAG: hypothetical protein M1816_001814 [Peltula sp. TS41687]|nr:MAG: hypothetical protein M1816_001814 [Peltula sp. TS41687]